MSSSSTHPGNFSSNTKSPLDIWVEVLSYLPVRSLLRFRSVCKLWKSAIESHEFASIHLNRCPNNNRPSEHLILNERVSINQYIQLGLNHPGNHWLLRRSDTFESVSEIEFPTIDGVFPWFEWDVRGSINGLFLLQIKPDNWGTRRLNDWKMNDVFLWNPSIRKMLCLPRPNSIPSNNPSEDYPFELCLGFDPSCNDYKVVMIVHEDNLNSQPISPPSVKIFSLQSRSWRKVADGTSGIRSIACANQKKLSLKGSIHWIGESYSSDDSQEPICLVSFDITTETFSYTPLPSSVTPSCGAVPIVVDGSSVGLFSPHSIWVLEKSNDVDAEYVTSSWVKRYRINCLYPAPWTFIYLKKDGRLLYKQGNDARTISSYDPKIEETSAILLASFARCPVMYHDAYVESLVLLK